VFHGISARCIDKMLRAFFFLFPATQQKLVKSAARKQPIGDMQYH
jgi:hypothetical protein